MNNATTYQVEEESFIDIKTIRKLCKTLENADEWGVAELWFGNKGVEYNYCIDDGENCSAIYKTEINEKNGYRETDYSSFIHYEVDFNDMNWKTDLLNELHIAFEELHKIGI